jgi:hypothetical protein
LWKKRSFQKKIYDTYTSHVGLVQPVQKPSQAFLAHAQNIIALFSLPTHRG